MDAANLAVVGLLEVVAHIPRIYGEYRKLLAAARERRPDLAILTDSPGFSPAGGPPPAQIGRAGGLSGGAAGLGVAQRTGQGDAPRPPAPAVHLSL